MVEAGGAKKSRKEASSMRVSDRCRIKHSVGPLPVCWVGLLPAALMTL